MMWKSTTQHVLKMVLIAGFTIGSWASYAQEIPQDEEEEITIEMEKGDTTEIKISNRKVLIISDEEGKKIEIKENNDDDEYEFEEEDWDDEYDYEPKERSGDRSKSKVSAAALDLGITNYWVNGTYGAEAASQEIALPDFRLGSHVALHLLPTRVSLIGRGVVNLKTAFTIDWSNYYFTNHITLVEGDESIGYDTTGVSFTRNKLTSRYAQIPLMLNFNTNPGSKKGLSVSVGGYAGVLWGAKTKQVSAENGKVKVRGDFNLNPVRYGVLARFDFVWLDLYLQYNLSEMFRENEGPATQTFVAGINLVDF